MVSHDLALIEACAHELKGVVVMDEPSTSARQAAASGDVASLRLLQESELSKADTEGNTPSNEMPPEPSPMPRHRGGLRRHFITQIYISHSPFNSMTHLCGFSLFSEKPDGGGQSDGGQALFNLYGVEMRATDVGTVHTVGTSARCRIRPRAPSPSARWVRAARASGRPSRVRTPRGSPR